MATSKPMIESHYVESSDGLFFAVKGLIHPPQAVVAYLRYTPDPDGNREKGGIRYRRLYHFEEQKELLRENLIDFGELERHFVSILPDAAGAEIIPDEFRDYFEEIRHRWERDE